MEGLGGRGRKHEVWAAWALARSDWKARAGRGEAAFPPSPRCAVAFPTSSVPAAPRGQLRRRRRQAGSMLRKLTLDQINDWFTIGKTVTNVELLGSPPAFPAEAARDEAQRRDAAPALGPAAQAQAQPVASRR